MSGSSTSKPRAKRKRSNAKLASARPFGLGARKPHHFLEMFQILWANRDNLRYGWKVLSRGTCDGCALGTKGLKDWTISGTHLCLVRLNLLRLNTMGPLDPARLADVSQLAGKTSKELRALGRIPGPMVRRRGEKGFQPIGFDQLWSEVGERWRGFDPDRTALYMTSRGITNEVYYVAQKVMRYLGTNNVDNAARLCHSPSTAGLKSTVGVAATTCSYQDWYESDLIVFLGSNPANDQPVALKYLQRARKQGARVLVVNPYREPGMDRYWIPSDVDSALFGSKLTDRFVPVGIGGDLALLNAVAKLLIERGHTKTDFIEQATEGFEDLQRELAAQSFEKLVELSGTPLEAVEAFADEVAQAGRAVFVWSMGITQHTHGADTVRAIANLGLLRESVGRNGTGLMPIRGHSGVQGGAEMGAYATAFPGGLAIDESNAKHFSELYGFEVPAAPGLDTVAQLEQALEGRLDALYAIGGNFLETMPQPDRMERALAAIPLRIHSDLFPTHQMFVEPAQDVYLLPAATRYEQRGGGTETSTERRIIYSPEIPRDDLPGVRSEWEMLLELAKAVNPENYDRVHFEDSAAIRAEIEQAVPVYAGIAGLSKFGDSVQIGGRHLCADRSFPMPSGKARFVPVRPPGLLPQESLVSEAFPFRLATRRGKQFNSMVQKQVDQLNGAARDHILISTEDANRLGFAMDDPIRVRSAVGEFRGRAFLCDLQPGTAQGHWPEVNVLIPHGRVDRDGGVPDYNASVSLERA